MQFHRPLALPFVLLLALFVMAPLAGAQPLYSYNVVVTGTLTDSSHIQGTTFVNDLDTVDQPDFAADAPSGSEDTLSVTGTISGSGLTVENGTFIHANPLPGGFTENLNGAKPDVLDPSLGMSSLISQIGALSTYYNGLPANASTTTGVNALNFNPTGNGLSVYDVTQSSLMGSNLGINIDLANSTQAVLIDISGTTFDFNSSEHVSLTGSGSAAQIVWYFPSATSITLMDSTWMGSILAPLATLDDNSQDINGGVYVANFDQTAEVHLPTPTPPLLNAPVPELATGVMLAVGMGLGLLRRKRTA
jgi:choice-of-anchor A domain-containing protein